MSGNLHSARATARTMAGSVTVTWIGNAGSSSGTLNLGFRLTTRLVTVAASRHRAGCEERTPPPADESGAPGEAWPGPVPWPDAGTLPHAASASKPRAADTSTSLALRRLLPQFPCGQNDPFMAASLPGPPPCGRAGLPPDELPRPLDGCISRPVPRRGRGRAVQGDGEVGEPASPATGGDSAGEWGGGRGGGTRGPRGADQRASTAREATRPRPACRAARA